MTNNTVVLGLGNILLSDEGAGVRAVEALQARYHFPKEVRLIDGGTLGLDLLPLLEGIDKVLFIDAVNLRQEPGTVAVLGEAEIPSCLEPKLSFHHVGLADLLFAAGFKGITPAQVSLIGIQPEETEVGLALSAPVTQNFAKLLKAVLEKLREWGVEVVEKPLQEPIHVSGRSL